MSEQGQPTLSLILNDTRHGPDGSATGTMSFVIVLLLLYPLIKMIEYQNEVMAQNLKDLDSTYI